MFRLTNGILPLSVFLLSIASGCDTAEQIDSEDLVGQIEELEDGDSLDIADLEELEDGDSLDIEDLEDGDSLEEIADLEEGDGLEGELNEQLTAQDTPGSTRYNWVTLSTSGSWNGPNYVGQGNTVGFRFWMYKGDSYKVLLHPISGDADLYTSNSQWISTSNAQCKSRKGGTAIDKCGPWVAPFSGWNYVLVKGYYSSDYEITAVRM